MGESLELTCKYGGWVLSGWVFQVGVSNVHGSMLMYLLERGFLNAKEVKSCVLVGMAWEGRGGERAVSHPTMEHLTIQPSQHATPTPTPLTPSPHPPSPDTVQSVPPELCPQRS